MAGFGHLEWSSRVRLAILGVVLPLKELTSPFRAPHKLTKLKCFGQSSEFRKTFAEFAYSAHEQKGGALASSG